MDIEAEYEEYLSTQGLEKRYITRLRTVIDVLKNQEVQIPVVSDFESLRRDVIVPQLISEQSVKKETASTYATEFKKFNNWLLGKQEVEKGDNQMSMFEDKDMANEQIEQTNEVTVNKSINIQDSHVEARATEPSETEKTESKGKSDTEKRKQISAYLDANVYEGLKALSSMSRQSISDIVSRVMNSFYENNYEAIQESIRVVRENETVMSKIKYGIR